MYVGIFKPGKHPPAALFQNDWASFLQGWQDVGIFEPGGYGPAAVFTANDWDGFLERWQQLE